MALEVQDTLRAEGDLGTWAYPETNGMHAVGVRVVPDGSFDGSIVFETVLLAGADGDAVAVGDPVTAATEFVALIPRGWKFRANMDTLAAGTVSVTMFEYRADRFGAAGARMAGSPAAAFDFATAGADLVTSGDFVADLGAIVTDLEGDTAGDSVAQALIDLDLVIVAISHYGNAVTVVNGAFEPEDADLTAFTDGMTAANTDLNTVFTALEGDVAGNSVAGAITGINAVITDLGAL